MQEDATAPNTRLSQAVKCTACVKLCPIAFVPLFLGPKWSRFRKAVMVICIALALLIPSLYLQWDSGQTLMLVVWVPRLCYPLQGVWVKSRKG